jgi:hypothetical protein
VQVFKALEEEADEVWERCEKERKYVYGQQLSSEKPEDLPSGTTPLQPIAFAVPAAEYSLEFEQV